MSMTLSHETNRRTAETDLRHEVATYIVLPSTIGLGVITIWLAEAARWPWHASLLGLAVLVLPVLTLALLQHYVSTALGLFVVACMGVSIFVIYWFPSGVAYCLLALPTGAAFLLTDTRTGILTAAAASLIVLGGPEWLGTPAFPERYQALILVLGTGMLLWGSSRLSKSTFDSLWPSYKRMQQLLEEARDQRLELKQTQEDLVQANRQLSRLSDRLAVMYQYAEEARRVKEEFVANVSHELRTPLNMIIGFTEMITQTPDMYGVALPPSLLADMAIVRRNSEHLASLVDDVLDLSQFEAGQMSISRDWVPIQEIVDAAVVAVMPLFEAKRLSVTTSIPHDLPLIHCDRTRIRQVVLNLLSNAGRFTEKGGAHIEVQQSGANLEVSVADTGSGIPPASRERVFEPFQQVDGSLRRKYGGTGLGLSISKRFVEMHGGRMWVDSEVGAGTVFHFALPIREPANPLPRSVLQWFSPYDNFEPRSRPSKAPTTELRPRFVIMESGDELRSLLSRYLENAELVTIRNWEQAIEEMARQPAQALIINDAGISDTSGSQLIDLPYDTPAIHCWLPGKEEAAGRLGVVRYLLKPVSKTDLLAAIDGLGIDVRTILLVDDQPEMLQLLGRMLGSSGRGYKVIRAADGNRALSLLHLRRPDLVLLDLIMPGTDGQAILEHIRGDPAIRDIPAIAVSAQDPARQTAALGPSLTIARSNGLSVRDLVACVQALAVATTSERKPAGQASPRRTGD